MPFKKNRNAFFCRMILSCKICDSIDETEKCVCEQSEFVCLIINVKRCYFSRLHFYGLSRQEAFNLK